MVYMRTCMHRKVPELEEFEKKFLMRTFDKVDKLTDGNGFAIVFDLTGTGYSNVDLDFLRFLIDCTSYYPVGLKYILVTNLPWILNAVRKTVMLIMPESLVGILRFASGDQIFEYIAKENVPDFLGGTCRRNYRQVPQGSRPVEKLVEEFGYSEEDVKRIMPKYQDLLDKADEMLANNEYDDVDQFPDIPTPAQLRDYSFANRLKLRMQRGEITEREYRSQVDAIYRNYVGKIEDASNYQDGEAEQMQPDIITDLANKSGAESIGSLANGATRRSTRSGSLFHVIKVTPDRLLYLERDSEDDEYSADVCVENNTDGFVAYKVQSNRPEAYSVSPSFGIILPRKTIRFCIRTVNGRHRQMSKDKFLVLAIPVTSGQMTFEQFKLLWGQNMHQSVESVRLHARLLFTNQSGLASESPTTMEDASTSRQLDALLKRCEILQQSQIRAQRTINLLLLLVLFLFVVLLASGLSYTYQKSSFTSISESTFDLKSIGNYDLFDSSSSLEPSSSDRIS